jgi:hypothetical protein
MTPDRREAGSREPKDLSREVCAWCGAIVRDGIEPVSHGMCQSCRQAQAYWGESPDVSEGGL